MDKKAILFIVIAFGFMLLYSKFYYSLYPPKKPVVSEKIGSLESKPIQETKESWTPPRGHEMTSELMTQEEEIILENDDVKIAFSTIRAAIKSLELKENSIIRDKPVSLIKFVNYDAQPGALTRIGDFPYEAFYLFSIKDRGSDFVIFESVYKGFTLTKRYQIKSSYLLELRIEINNQTEQDLPLFRGYDLNIGLLHIGKSRSRRSADDLAIQEYNYFLSGGKGSYESIKPSKIKDKTVFKEEILWAGIKSKYFTLIALPEETTAHAHIGELVQDGVYRYSLSAIRLDDVFLSKDYAYVQNWQLYLGPRDYNILNDLGHNLVDVMDLSGLWGSLSKGLLFSLKFLSRVLFHNYGLAIIVLTLIMKLIFYPLSAISLQSMKQMQLLQPQMTELRKKFKENPKKLQQATMQLYKDNNVKPLSGCLPIIVQIPIFIAFYKVLLIDIDLRGADFLWISNLAGPDTIFKIGSLPLNILPILNGAAMFLQQRMTPSDPSQKMLKLMMPLMITFFFYSLPSGLILYWFVTTLVTIFQQYHIHRKPA